MKSGLLCTLSDETINLYHDHKTILDGFKVIERTQIHKKTFKVVLSCEKLVELWIKFLACRVKRSHVPFDSRK